MNYAKVTAIAATILSVAAYSHGEEIIIPISSNPPWVSNRTYTVESKYDLTYSDIVISVDGETNKKWYQLFTPGKFKDKELKITGTYTCPLIYRTFSAGKSGKQGYAFRDYNKSEISFGLHNPSKELLEVFDWLYPDWEKRTRSKEEMIEKTMEGVDFPYSSVFKSGDNTIDDESTYLISWDEPKDYADGTVSIKKRKKDTDKIVANEEMIALGRLNFNDIQKIKAGKKTDRPVLNDWKEIDERDLGYHVIQSESKLMTYAIYGNKEQRDMGEAWTVSADILEAFFPEYAEGEKPFTFNKRGRLILEVEKIDEKGRYVIVSTGDAIINDCKIFSDIEIIPNTKNNTTQPKFEFDEHNSKKNEIRFIIDPNLQICVEATMKIVLEDYNGPIPVMEQFDLNKSPKIKKINGVNIRKGNVLINAKITTSVDDSSVDD